MLKELFLFDIDIDSDSGDFVNDVDVDDTIGNVEVLNISCAGKSLK